MLRVFISYSHKDESVKQELDTHFAMLKRTSIDVWHDRRIEAGDNIDHAIDENLLNSDIIILLVSKDFIASKYCFDIEMAKALELHHSGSARVFPVIVGVCDWHDTPFGKLNALPRDGKPIDKFPDRNDGFMQVVKAVKDFAKKKVSIATNPTLQMTQPTKTQVKAAFPRTGNLRVKHTFTDKEAHDFIESAFEYISNYFEASLNELEKRNVGIESKFTRIDATHFVARIYKNGKCVSECKVWQSSKRMMVGDICYSSDASSGDNSMNAWVSLQNDGYQQYFSNSGFGLMQPGVGNHEQQLTNEGVAEEFWTRLVSPLQ